MANSPNKNSPSSPNNPHNTANDNAGGSPPPPPPPGFSPLPSPTPPPAIPSGPGGNSGEGSNPSKKKKRSGKKPGVVVAADDQQGSGAKKMRREMDAPKGEPICCVCRKKFGSWKAVFGHLRAHTSSRDWRGAFPPPSGDALAWLPQNSPEQALAPTLLRLARETLEKMRQENILSGAGSSSAGVVTGFDLNKEPPEELDNAVAGSPPPPLEGGGLDLNLPPSEEKKDEEMGGDVGEDK